MATMQTIHQRKQVLAALETAKAVAEAIRELGEVPEGHLYAHLAGHLSLEQLQSILRVLTNAGLIRVDRSHMITWIGCEVMAQEAL